MIHRYRRYIACLLLLFPAASVPVWAQSGVLSGLIQDEISGMGVNNTLVLNYSTGENVYSDNQGVFILEASTGDTVVISAVGYYLQKIVVNDSLLAVPVAEFKFMPRAYELSEAKILGLGSYNNFKNSFLELKKPKTKVDILSENLGSISKNAGREAYDRAIASGRIHMPGAGIPILSPEEKERKTLKKILEREQARDQVYLNFNPEVIKKVTGLADDREILAFMTFCDFSDEYLLEVSEYDLAWQIGVKYEEYKIRRGTNF